MDRQRTPTVLERCAMILLDESGRTRAICMWHVDEFPFAGLLGDETWEQEFEATDISTSGLTGKLEGWEQCGWMVKQHAGMSSTLDLSHYLVHSAQLHGVQRSRVTFLELHQSATFVGVYDSGTLPWLVCVTQKHDHIPMDQTDYNHDSIGTTVLFSFRGLVPQLCLLRSARIQWWRDTVIQEERYRSVGSGLASVLWTCQRNRMLMWCWCANRKRCFLQCRGRY